MFEIVDLKIQLDELRKTLDKEITYGECLQTVQKVYYEVQKVERLMSSWEQTNYVLYN